VTGPSYRLAPWAAGLDLESFDCGGDAYNRWLADSAAQAQETGSARVFLLLENAGGTQDRVVGYFAVCPTLVVRDELPKPMRRRQLRYVPGWLLAKLAIEASLRGRPEQWGRQLLREALLTILAAAERGGGAVIAVDAENVGLVPFYERNGFLPTGADGLRMFMKVATAKAYLTEENH